MAIMAWHDACQLDTSLRSLDHFFSLAPEYAQTLTGGLTNRCWKVKAQSGDCFVWRPSTHITKSLSISRFHEQQILSLIQDTNLAPKPVYLHEHGLLVEWIEGEPLTNELPFDSLLRTLAKIHSLDITKVPIAPFNYTARIDHYWMLLRENLQLDIYRDLYQQWRNVPSLGNVDTSLCHFDLAGYNMVKHAEGNKVIDWEYACISDPRLDLAITICVTGEKPLESVYRYCQLRDIEDVNDWIEGVMAWKPRADVMAMLWYLLAYQLKGHDRYLVEAQTLGNLLTSQPT
ncbi:phosphotransferase [Vibrio pectenicida]|uniref:Phosphotransferase n=1 Tax=Vibrio pectenicida TaxID=62763 RepID=A0A7Y4A0F3_9VIBR|nr:phosphotransferase [Vibrio pectenicida]NOH72312.1 phosphotransferase [Vibrio pectenicida]